MSALTNANISIGDACTGCGACYNSCPLNLITMKCDVEGFKFPIIDQSRCTNCGVCVKSCPIIDYRPRNAGPKAAYAVMANDEIRFNSSSGGMFTLGATEILNKGGYVCGAAFTDNFHSVEHIVISNKDDLQKLRKSKYVQSDTVYVYREIKQILTKEHRPVLFCGCPCQVDALYSFLGGDHQNLYTIDLICHGVPSPKIWTEYAEHVSGGENIISADFRNKESGWSSYKLTIQTDDGVVYKGDRNKDLYLRAFLANTILRRSCYECVYTNMQRPGDLTIGDLWGVLRMPEYNDKKGTSVVFVNTEKGAGLFEKTKSSAKMCEEIPFDLARRSNTNLARPSIDKLDGMGLEQYRKNSNAHLTLQHISSELNLKAEALRKSRELEVTNLKSHYDVCLYGWYWSLNHGSTINFFAVHKMLRDLGLSVLILRYGRTHEPWLQRNLDIVGNDYVFSNPLPEARHSELCSLCDTFVVGSDNFWSGNNVRMIEHRTLGFVDDCCRKVSLATSVRPKRRPKEIHDIFKKNLSKFDFFSVREQKDANIFKDELGLPAHTLLEPVFWHDVSIFDEIINKKVHSTPPPYVLGAIYNNLDDGVCFTKFIQEKLGIDRKMMFRTEAGNTQDIIKPYLDSTTIMDFDISDFLFYIKQSKFVVTNSFHVACFAIIYNIPFMVVAPTYSGRFTNLFNLLGLEDRLCMKLTDDLYKRQDLLDGIDYESVNQKVIENSKIAHTLIRQAFDL